MILVTVGAQMPFDRLVGAVDDWAGRRRDADVLAQIGPAETPPRNVRWVRFMSPDEFRAAVRECDAVVAHAGMGTILTALELRKPLVVMPRRGDLAETRNDHQVATAERFRALGRVVVAEDAAALHAWLDRVGDLRPTDAIAPGASPELIRALRGFVADVAHRRAQEGGAA